ncbi:MAG: hypothetical protein ACK4R6_12155 [Spirosomataceae bacterium]
MKFPLYIKLILLALGFVALFFNTTIGFSLLIFTSFLEILMRYVLKKE